MNITGSSAVDISPLKMNITGSSAVDISPLKDGGVLKEITTPGSGDESPLTGDKVQYFIIFNSISFFKYIFFLLDYYHFRLLCG